MFGYCLYRILKLLAQTGRMGTADGRQEPSQADLLAAQRRQQHDDARELRVALARTIGALRNACVGAASSTAELLGGEDPTGFAEVCGLTAMGSTLSFTRDTT